MQAPNVRLPCDQCHERRIRCKTSHDNTCEACQKAGSACTRTLQRKKRGPKAKKIARPSTTQNNGEHRPLSISSLVDPSPPSDTATFVKQRDVLENQTPGPPQQSSLLMPPSSHNADTITGLASTILHGLDDPANDVTWKSDLRRSQGLDKKPSAFRITISPSLFKETGHQNIISSRQVPSSDYHLDGTALATATSLPSRYGPELVACFESYFGDLHHVVPVLHKDIVGAMLSRPGDLTVFQRSLFLSICAIVKLKTWCADQENTDPAIKDMGCEFLDQSLRLRANREYTEDNSPLTVVASYLLHFAHACLDLHKSSRVYLQEGICRAIDLRLHFNQVPESAGIETICAQRCLALLFVTERAMIILNDWAGLILRWPPSLPNIWFDVKDRKVLDAFRALFELFSVLEADIVDFWCTNRVTDGAQRNRFRDILKHMQSRLVDMDYLTQTLDDQPKADILVTQQWLRLISWQVSNRLHFLSSSPSHPAFSINYIIEIARDLSLVIDSVPESAFRVHHFSIYNKMFEIAFALMDVITVTGRNSNEGANELRTLFRYLSTSPIKDARFLKVLQQRDDIDGNVLRF